MKTCFKCNIEQSLESFHKHKMMRDGRLNKCSFCVVRDVAEWRKLGKRDSKKERANALLKNEDVIRLRESERSKKYYAKHLSRPRVLKTKEELLATKSKSEARRRAKNKCPQWDRDFTDFVFKEARLLAKQRERHTNFKWHVDHIVPLNGKIVSGFHVWNNFQVIPATLNVRKNNKYAG